MADRTKIDDAIDNDPNHTLIKVAKNLRAMFEADADLELFVRLLVETVPSRAKKQLALLIEENDFTIETIDDDTLQTLVNEALMGEIAGAVVCEDYFDETP